MSLEPTSRQMAAVARRAAEIIVERGKATGVVEDEQGRVCALKALHAARVEMGYEASSLPVRVENRARSASQPLSIVDWNDLPTTTEADIAAVFLRVADEIEAAS